MSKLQRENLMYMLLSIALVIGGYIFMRYAYRIAEEVPFSQEILLIALGTIVTILITAMLLNKQTEVELKKEENIKFTELKTDIYLQLIENIEDIILDKNIDEKDRIKLRILTHKLAIVASPDVLTQYEHFVDEFSKIASSKAVKNTDINTLMDELAELSIYIRQDLVGDLDIRHGTDLAQLKKQIINNSDALN